MRVFARQTASHKDDSSCWSSTLALSCQNDLPWVGSLDFPG